MSRSTFKNCGGRIYGVQATFEQEFNLYRLITDAVRVTLRVTD
jgi:hypothetical protein